MMRMMRLSPVQSLVASQGLDVAKFHQDAYSYIYVSSFLAAFAACSQSTLVSW
jgi:hypothetical protein